MRRTEPWWVCDKCGKPIVRPKKGSRNAMLEHRKVCNELACFSIVQIEQRKGGREAEGVTSEK